MAKKRRTSKSSDASSSTESRGMDDFFALESAPPASVMDELELRGGAFPPPEELTDATLTPMLWRMLRSLACMRTFVRSTDHLTDRQLYTHLWRDTLRDESFVATPRGLHGGFFLDLVGSGSDTDYETYARHYMSGAMRRFHEKQGMKLPRKQCPPFKRDRFLPKCGRPFDEGPPFAPKKWRAPRVEQYTR